MTKSYKSLQAHVKKSMGLRTLDEVLLQLAPSKEDYKPRIPNTLRNTPESVEEIYSLLKVSPETKHLLWDDEAQKHLDKYDPNIENYIGTAKIPIGLAGPLRVNGVFAKGDYYIPMATTEAALVGSYHRGCQLISEVGGCSAMLLSEGISRAPLFVFNNLREAGCFVFWAIGQVEEFRRIAEKTTRFGKLSDMLVNVHGCDVFLIFEYTTGDASGQNMVTIATQAIYECILQNSPVKPRMSFLESNMSGDKKATAQAFQQVRGKKVTAEVIIPDSLMQTHMGVSATMMVEYSTKSTTGSLITGSIGAQGHMANALAAIFIACGQDAACVGESAVGITTASLTPQGDLYVSVSLPNVMLGTVGGGTGLPTPKACLEIMGIPAQGGAPILAEVVAGVVLAGEISIAAAFVGGYFSKAHQVLARFKKKSMLQTSNQANTS